MKLHFEPNLDFQLAAVEAVCDLFRGDEEIRTMCIGPAEANRARFACLITGPKNAAGRTGLGALMGSKRLKLPTPWVGRGRCSHAGNA
ncbi:MAG: aldehyde ferredoxin oxidoreductase N-terminal domain-containing protein [Pseudomonadota bacterium]